MRKTLLDQLALVAVAIGHPPARELEAVSERLERVPEAGSLIDEDLVQGVVHPQVGRAGMTAAQVLRCVLAKQVNSWSYRGLAFQLADSLSYRRFCRFGVGATIATKSTKRLALDMTIENGNPADSTYTWASLVAHNLLVLARHDMARAEAGAAAA